MEAMKTYSLMIPNSKYFLMNTRINIQKISIATSRIEFKMVLFFRIDIRMFQMGA